MKISTNWLRDFVTLKPPLEELADRLTWAGLEVKKIESKAELKDTIFETEVTTNRPDWLSHLGVAREIRAVDNTGIKLPPSENPAHRPLPAGWKLDLKEAEGCPYYSACLIEGIQNFETPDWMAERLQACGLRSINLIVDITNYVLLEAGQPLHAFDADLLRGREIVIRRAKPEENFIAINGIRYSLNADDLVIADKERAVALAGVMGGQETEVGLRTRNILLESAFFNPCWVRRTALRHGLSSESSYRFERRVDPEGVDFAMERAIRLFRELTGARTVYAVLRTGRKPSLEKPRLHLSLEYVKKILGADIKPHQVHSTLTRLGLEVRNEGPETWVVGIPSYRSDLERPVDLVEEVARLVGYEAIPETLPVRPPLEMTPNPLRNLEEKTREFMSGAGLFETMTFSLVNPEFFETAGFDSNTLVRIHNPIHQELTLLRPSFLESLLEVAARNERCGARSVTVFEIANLYSRKSRGDPPREEKSLGILLSGECTRGWSDPKRSFDFFDAKGILESYFEFLGLQEVSFVPRSFSFFERGVEIRVGEKTVGQLGEVASWVQEKWDLISKATFLEIALEALLEKLPRQRKFKEIFRFPAVERDLALVVDESVKMGEIVKEIQRLGKGFVRQVELFDLFRGGRIPKGKKNLAFRLSYQSPERTLLSEEVQRLHEEIARELVKKFQGIFQEG